MTTIKRRDINIVPYLPASDLGKAREHLFFRNGKQVHNLPQNKQTEIFCTYEGRDRIRERRRLKANGIPVYKRGRLLGSIL